MLELEREPERPVKLRLTPDEAVRLSTRLAQAASQ